MADISYGFWEKITTWLVKKLWPWIVEFVWPEIQRRIIDVFLQLIDGLIESIFDSSADRRNQQVEEAMNHAAEADKKAETATTQAEAEGFRELANHWREMAEQYKQEAKDLRQKLDSLAAQTAEKFEDSLDNLGLDKIIEEHDGKVRLTGTDKDLPALPSQDKNK